MIRIKLKINDPEKALFMDLYTIVDDDNKDLAEYEWWASFSKDYNYIQIRRFIKNEQGAIIDSKSLYQEIMSPPPNHDVHHKNHNRLDNRKVNLEVLPKAVHAKLPKQNSTEKLKSCVRVPFRTEAIATSQAEQPSEELSF